MLGPELSDGQSRLLDTGLFRADNEEPRYFGNGIGIGFDAMATLGAHGGGHDGGSLRQDSY